MCSYRSEVHNTVHGNDHEANDKRGNPHVEGFATETLGPFVVFLIIAVLGLVGEGRVLKKGEWGRKE